MTDSPNAQTLVLVTGGSGFLSLHIIKDLLTAGYKVRTTIRSEAKKSTVLKGLANASPAVDSSRVSFATADLLSDSGWEEACSGVTYVIHAASPFPKTQPKDENELIRPAVDGTLRVLKAAKKGEVKRTVITSSIAAVSYGVKYENGHLFTDDEWSDAAVDDDSNTAYAKSKTLAEKAAWDFISREGSDSNLELATVNPVGIFGPPLLLPTDSTTVGIIEQILQGKLPAVPDVRFNIVDVRDASSLHLLVMTHPEAKGRRFICNGGPSASFAETSVMLRKGMGNKARKAPTKVLPNFVVKMLSYVMPQLVQILGQLGRRKEFSMERAKGLGWEPRGVEEAIVSCGEALAKAGIV